MGQLADQQGPAGALVQGLVVGGHPGLGQQLGHHPGVDRRVLPHVEGGQVEAETVHRPDQIGQGPAGKGLAVMGEEGIQHGPQVGLQLGGAFIGLGRSGRRPRRRLTSEGGIGGGQPGVDAGQGLAIGLVGAMGRGIVRGGRQVPERRTDSRQTGGDGKLGAQPMDGFQVEVERRLGLAPQGRAHDLRGDIGIAVPVAADPGADGEEARRRLAQYLAPAGVERGQGGEETALEIGDRVVDLVGDIDPHRAQQPGAPEDRHLAQQGLFDGRPLRLAGRRIVSRQGGGDGHLAVEDALAAHLTGMGGDHRRHEGPIQQVADRGGFDALGVQGSDRAGQTVRPRIAAAIALNLVFGDVGDLQEAGERVGEADGVGEAEARQAPRHLIGRPRAGLAMKGHRGAADVLDLVEHSLAVFGADHIAQHPAQEADVGLQGLVRLGHAGGYIVPGAAVKPQSRRVLRSGLRSGS